MPMRSLLLSHDAELLRVFQPALAEMSIAADTCGEAGAALAALEHTNFDAIIVDCDDVHGGAGALRRVRESRANRSTVVFAVLNGGTLVSEAFDMGANFVMKKPISAADARRHLQQAQQLMQRERRRYFRHEARMPVYVSCGGLHDLQVQGLNVSEGGISVRIADASLEEENVRLRFQLPGEAASVQVSGKVAWQDQQGRIGIRFLGIAEPAIRQLQQWMARQPVSVPGD